MFILQRATDTPMTADRHAGDDVLAQQAEFEELTLPDPKQIAMIVVASIAALIGLLVGIFVFHKTQRWYKERRWRSSKMQNSRTGMMESVFILPHTQRSESKKPLVESGKALTYTNYRRSLYSASIIVILMDAVFTLVQSSSAQSALPVLTNLISNASDHVLLFCLLYPPTSLLDVHADIEHITVLDWTDRVPGYSQSYTPDTLLDAIKKSTAGQSKRITIIIDSIDTLASDINSTPSTYALLSQILTLPSTKRLILHTHHPFPTSPSSFLLQTLTQTSFSSSLTHIIAHPTTLLLHISSTYLSPPPPLSQPQKFWSIFLPISQRPSEINELVFGPKGPGNSVTDEFVLELLVRNGSGPSENGKTKTTIATAGRKNRTVDRTLQGWNAHRSGLCELKELDSLQSLWSSSNKPASAHTPEKHQPTDPTANLSFNLNLTPSQQAARAKVPLPYVHQGQHSSVASPAGAIFYDPDSADDIDDDDPDEDLDI